MKLWIRTQSGDKIKDSATVETTAVLTSDSLTELLREALYPMDVPTPAVLPSHVAHLKSFSVTRFKSADFVERIDFDTLVVEILRDGKEKRPHRRNPLDEA